MRSVLVDGYEYPADPPRRPKGLDDVRALGMVVASLTFCRGQVGFHERSLYRQLCRMESAVRKRLDASREASGRSLELRESSPKLLSEL